MNSNSLVNLENLKRIGQLDPVPESPELARSKVVSVRKRMADAKVVHISNETRFEAAYSAIREMAEVGLLIHGLRTSTSRPGHHQTAIQCLPHTLGVAQALVPILDRLRKQRSISEYDGSLVTSAELTECTGQAEVLLPVVEAAMKRRGWAT